MGMMKPVTARCGAQVMVAFPSSMQFPVACISASTGKCMTDCRYWLH